MLPKVGILESVKRKFKNMLKDLKNKKSAFIVYILKYLWMDIKC